MESVSYLRRLIGRCVVTAAVLSACSALVLMVHIIVNTTMRYTMHKQILGTNEVISNWWMVLIVFPVLAVTQRNREHIDVTAVTDLMPKTQRIIAHIFSRIVAVGIVLMMVYLGWHYAIKMAEFGEYALGAVKVPIWPMRFVVPVGMALFAIQMILDITDDLRDLKGAL